MKEEKAHEGHTKEKQWKKNERNKNRNTKEITEGKSDEQERNIKMK